MSATIQPLTEHRFPADEVLQAVAAHEVLVADSREVRSYLEQHSDIASLVPLIVARTRQEFGDEAQLIMSVYRDPEIDDHYLQLCVRLQQDAPLLLERLLGVCEPFEDVLAVSPPG